MFIQNINGKLNKYKFNVNAIFIRKMVRKGCNYKNFHDFINRLFIIQKIAIQSHLY
jgi:hypothetical protein